MEGNNNTWQWQKMWLQSTQVALTKQCRLLKYVDNELHVTMILKHWFAQGMLQDHHDVWEWYMISVSWMLVLLSMHFINKPIWSNSFVSFFSLSLSLSLSLTQEMIKHQQQKRQKKEEVAIYTYCTAGTFQLIQSKPWQMKQYIICIFKLNTLKLKTLQINTVKTFKMLLSFYNIEIILQWKRCPGYHEMGVKRIGNGVLVTMRWVWKELAVTLASLHFDNHCNMLMLAYYLLGSVWPYAYHTHSTTGHTYFIC